MVEKIKAYLNIDIKTCEACQGYVKIITCIKEPVVMDKRLTQLKTM